MKSTFLSSRAISFDLGLLILRLVAGGAMLTHGFPKLQMIVNQNHQFGDPVGLGPILTLYLVTFAEFICSILVILGIQTRLATIPLIIDMSVALFIVHAKDDFGTKELALIFLSMFLTIFFTGPGKYSVER